MLDHELVAFVRISCILSSISPCFCLFVFVYLRTISFKFFLYGDPRIIFCTQLCRTIPYLLLTVARAILCECFNFLYKWTLPAFGENIRGIDIQKDTYLLQLGEAKLLGCVWLHKVAYIHSVTHYRVMERYFLMDNVAEVVQCRFFFCCLEIFFIWLIEAIAWLHYHILLFACLWQLQSVDTFFHIPFLLGTFSAGSLSVFCFVFVLFCFVLFCFCFCFSFFWITF